MSLRKMTTKELTRVDEYPLGSQLPKSTRWRTSQQIRWFRKVDKGQRREIRIRADSRSTAGHDGFLETNQRKLSFPPRFGEHNEKIYGDELGMESNKLATLKAEGIIYEASRGSLFPMKRGVGRPTAATGFDPQRA